MSQMPDRAKAICEKIMQVLGDSESSESQLVELKSAYDALQAKHNALIARTDILLTRMEARCLAAEDEIRKYNLRADSRLDANEATFKSALSLIAKTRQANALPSSHQAAIDDICHFIRANRDRFWDENGECEPHFLPPIGYIKQVGGGPFFLFTGGAFLEATRCGNRVSTAKILDRYGILSRHEHDRYTSQHRISCLMSYGRFYAVNAKIFELESGVK